MSIRPSLDQLGLSAGKKTRLYRILHEHGLRNGTAIFLPYDHGLEHGPRDFVGHPSSSDPKHIIKLALEGGFNGIASTRPEAARPTWRPGMSEKGTLVPGLRSEDAME
jgi:fructose-bisphosphate aldolase, class I